ncbi:apical sushi protein [Plasmodium reichenowi]|uniref:Apical sushi protein n=1 Tax=Plasmodium reichenowi TaxID=5854 RepID=A0A2P9D549_PLARE|nr:apical sushi protein [Plasmodium reichenowi]
MKIIYHILIFLLHYNIIIKAKENKNDNFLNGIYKLQNIWRNTTLGELDLKMANIENAEGIIEKFNDSNKSDINQHPHFRSKLSFLEHKNHKDMGIVTNHQNKVKDDKKNEYISEEIIDMKPQLASQEMWRKGENFYIHGATNTNEQNDDEDLFESFHKNHNSNIKINSPCFDLQDKEMCSNNKECFYDDAYKACFQNCILVNEQKCSLYSECKHTPNGCQNEGYLNIQVFGSNLGGDVRACELFESEGSCYLMEKLFQKLSEEKKETSFNCVWISYKHELRSYDDENEPKENNDDMVALENKNKYIYMNNVESIHKNHHLENPYHEDIKHNKHKSFNYHVLSSSVPRQIAKNERFLSLLQLNLKGKKKEKKRKKKDDEDDDIDEEDDDLDIEGKNNEFNDEEEENNKDLKNNNIDGNEEDGTNDKDDLFNKKKKKNNNNNNNNNNSNNNNSNNNNNNNKNKQNTNKKNNKIINEFDDDIDEVSEENLLNDEEKKQNKIKNKNINETDNISENNEIEISSKDLTEQYEDKYNYDKKNNMGTNNNFNNTNTFVNNKNNLHNKYINHASHTQNEKDILKHNFYGKDKNGTYEIIKVETHICANLNEKPNPSTLLEGALIAENEAQLQKIKKKFKVTDNEICVRPTNSSYVSLIPDKKYYLLGEKIEFKCQEGYNIIGTTNIGVCTGRNIISPNITCESLTNFDDVEKDNIQKMNNIINSASKYTFYNIIIIVFIIINLFFCA